MKVIEILSSRYTSAPEAVSGPEPELHVSIADLMQILTGL